MWLKVQQWIANGLILLCGAWCYLHFRESGTVGIALPLLITGLAVGWRMVLSSFKSFYSH